MPFSLAAPAHHELVIKKSRFIACVETVSGRDEALNRVAQLKARHPDAAHVCWALLAGGQSAANDDGDPATSDAVFVFTSSAPPATAAVGNRVRVTATGRLLLCLGQENSVDLRATLRGSSNPASDLRAQIIAAMQHKPEKHTFDINNDEPQIVRFMNMTGG